MRRVHSLLASVILSAAATACLAAPLSFEVATVKAAQMGGPQHEGGKMAVRIGMTIDAARVEFANMSLMDLVSSAYKVKANQISGPDWMRTERFDIGAKIPEGVSTDQVNVMLQTLLAERFKLAIHRGEKEQPIYALVVGKGGPKLKESAPVEAPAADGPGPNAVHGNGTVRAGTNRMTMRDSKMQMTLSGMTMGGFVDTLSRFLDRPVLDMTELKGAYDMELEISQEDMRNMMRSQGMAMPQGGPMAGGGDRPADGVADPSGPNIFSTVQQYGLKLDARKGSIETIFVDHLEKTPTEN